MYDNTHTNNPQEYLKAPPQEPAPVEPWNFKLNPKEPGPIEPWLTRVDSKSTLVAPW